MTQRKGTKRVPRPEGLTAAELGDKVGVSARTVRFYTALGVLAAPAFRGPATRYSREHLLQMAAIRHLRQRGVSLDRIARQLSSGDASDIERLAAAFLPELGTGAAPISATSATLSNAALGSSVASESTAAKAGASSATNWPDAWYRLTLLPGLELHVHASACPEAQALARRLVHQSRKAM